MDFDFPDFLANETVQNDNLNLADLTQNYLTLKKKICETHEVIKQYNDKLKECERLKSDLDAVTKQTKKVTCSYNSTLAKVIKLELQSTEYKKNIDTLTTQVNDHKIKAAADQQHIQQLICKIKDVENQNNDKIMQYDLKKSSFEMKIKDLETELKTTKKTYETKIKKMEKKPSTQNNDCHSSNNIITKDVATSMCSSSNNIATKDVATNTCSNSNNIATKNVATNTSGPSNNVITKNVATNTHNNQTSSVGMITTPPKDEIMKKSQVSDKCILTDEFYSIKDDTYPIFCAKCEVLIKPTPFDKICKIMTESCPKLIEKISSPIKKPAPIRPNLTNWHKEAESLIALPETPPPPPHFYTGIAHSAFTSPNFPPPMPLHNLQCSHNCSQPSGLSGQSTFCIRSTPIRASLANTTTASQTDHCGDKTIDASSQSIIFSLQDKVDTLAKKLRKKMKKLKSQKSSNCCQYSHPNSPFDTNAMQFTFMELWRRMTDMYQPRQVESMVVHNPRNKIPKKSKSSRPKQTKRLQRAYNGNSWEVEPVSKKTEKSSARKRSKKCKKRHSMLLKTSEVSIEDSEHLEEPASDSDSNSYNALFDTRLTNENVSNGLKDSSREEAMNETRKGVTKPLSHSSAHSSDVDEPETVDSVKNLVEYSKSMSGETDSGILSDSVESNKVVQYERDLDSCFLPKTRRNTRGKATVKNASSFAGNFKTNRSQSTEKSPTNEDDEPNSVIPSFLQEEPETPKASEELEIPGASSGSVTGTRKRKFGEREVLKNRVQLMRKIRNLKKKPTKIQTVSKLNISAETAYCESRKEEEKEEEDYVPNPPKKKARIAHVPKPAKQANTSLKYCAQPRTSLVKNVEEEMDTSETTVDITEPSTSIAEETNVTQDTPADDTIAKDDSEKLADKNGNGTIEDISPLSPDPDSPDKMFGDERNEQPKTIPNEPVFDISALIEQSAQTRKGLEINLPARKKSVTIAKDDSEKLADKNGNGTIEDISPLSPDPDSPDKMFGDERNEQPKTIPNEPVFDISALIEQSAQTRKGLEINLPARKKSVIATDDTTNDMSALIEQSGQTTQELEIHLSARDRLLTETDNTENESGDEIRINENNQSKEWTVANAMLKECLKSSSCQDNDSPSMVEEGSRLLREHRANDMNYYKDIKLNSHAPIEILNRFSNENAFRDIHHRRKLKRYEQVRAAIDKFITKELQRLADSEWKSDVHQDVLEKLKTACTPRIIAKNIVEFISTEEKCNQELDKTHTPPAPLMTKTQQMITALLLDLEKEFPIIIELVQSGIEYKIFKFNQKLYRNVVESLARMYTVLARIQKDRERVRIFCCDALYCLGLNATIVLYTVFTSWPEVLPSNETTKEYLPKCIAHIILSMTAADYPKLSALKSLVRIYYKYPLGTLSKNMIIELLTAFQEKCQGDVMAAITLLAKKEGTKWTYKNIVKSSLLPMIVNNKCLSEYKAFSLLGTLMRPFPVEDEDKAVGNIMEQLCELCDSDGVSYEQQEGVMSALMSLSRHNYSVILPRLLKWTPNIPLRDRTVDQIYGLFVQREPTYWLKYIRSYKERKT